MGRAAQIRDLIDDLREQHPAIKIVRVQRVPEHSQGATVEPKRSRRAKRLWADPAYREKQRAGREIAEADPEVQAKRREVAFQNWLDPAYREAQREAHVTAWNDPAKRGRMVRGLRGRKFPEAAKRIMREAQQARRRREAAARVRETL